MSIKSDCAFVLVYAVKSSIVLLLKLPDSKPAHVSADAVLKYFCLLAPSPVLIKIRLSSRPLLA